MTAVHLPYGAILLKGFFSEQQQIELITDIFDTYAKLNSAVLNSNVAPNAMFTYNAGNRMQLYCKEVVKKNNDKDDNAINNIISVGEKIAAAFNKEKEKVYNFAGYDVLQADAMYCVSYNNNGSCYRHTDLWKSWVVGASFGLACDFRYGIGKNESAEAVYINGENNAEYLDELKVGNKDVICKIESGDVLIFNGHMLYHSVVKIYDGLPLFWDKIKNAHMLINRLNLQFRDSRIMNTNLNDVIVNTQQDANNMANLYSALDLESKARLAMQNNMAMKNK